MEAAVAEVPAFSGAAIVIYDDQPVFQYAKGVANQETGEPVTLKTRFNIGSSGKFLTMLAIAKLRDAGELKLDDSIVQYIPEFSAETSDKLTVRHLLSHKTTFDEILRLDESVLVSAKNNHAFFQIIFNNGFSAEPHAEHQYINTNFIVLGEIIERISGTSYEAHIREAILAPAGMDGFQFARAEDPDAPGNALGYLAMNLETWFNTPGSGASDKVEDYVHHPRKKRPNRMGAAAGGSFATVSDYLQLVRALSSETVISKETLDEFCAVDSIYRRIEANHGEPTITSGYGMGCGIRIHDGIRQIGHDGGGPGVEAQFDYFPELNAAVIVLTNHDSLASPVAGKLQAIVREERSTQ